LNFVFNWQTGKLANRLTELSGLYFYLNWSIGKLVNWLIEL